MMTSILRNSIVVLLASLTVMALGCGKGKWYTDPFFLIRSVDMYRIAVNLPPDNEVFPGHFTNEPIAFVVSISGGEIDRREPEHVLASKVEVDPGDGSGWLDFTQGWHETYGENAKLITGTHVYQESGEYSTHLRVTYWDGEVLNFTSSYPITIQPAPDPSE